MPGFLPTPPGAGAALSLPFHVLKAAPSWGNLTSPSGPKEAPPGSTPVPPEPSSPSAQEPLPPRQWSAWGLGSSHLLWIQVRLNFFQNYFNVLIITIIIKNSHMKNSASYSQLFFERAEVLRLIQGQPTEVLQGLGKGQTEENRPERKYSHLQSQNSRETRK